MGLDQYALAVAKNAKNTTFSYAPEAVVNDELHYWRKNYKLDKWMQELYTVKSGANADTCDIELRLSPEDLQKLEDDFFVDPFWKRFCEEYENNMEFLDYVELWKFLQNARQVFENGLDVYYRNSW